MGRELESKCERKAWWWWLGKDNEKMKGKMRAWGMREKTRKWKWGKWEQGKWKRKSESESRENESKGNERENLKVKLGERKKGAALTLQPTCNRGGEIKDILWLENYKKKLMSKREKMQSTTVAVFIINHVPIGVEWGGPSDGMVLGRGCQWSAVTQTWSQKKGCRNACMLGTPQWVCLQPMF